ncbi:MAG: phage DNA encapsidation protein [Bacteroidales bacterium]|nr:phage DNA encapsidation protein [Bacteroidales bacterium]
MRYYDGAKLLSLKDINGEKPEIYISIGNRSGGKTTYYNRMLVNRFKKKGEKFLLLYRWNYELTDIANKFFGDIGKIFFKDDVMKDKVLAKGKYCELYLNDELCGYAVSLNSANAVKKLSHVFNEVTSILFDEFMSEDGMYCPNEIEKFQSIHVSVSRGNGQPVRYVPVYLISNAVTLLNPYFETLGISARLQENTKFLRGEGYVLECFYNEEVKTAQSQSAFNRAFSKSKYQNYSMTNIYLNDNITFIENVEGETEYVCTIAYKGNEYAIRKSIKLGILYCDKRIDKTYPVRISATTDDFQMNYVMLESYKVLIQQLRMVFNRGAFRFKDLSCKECIMSIIAYN